MARPPVGRNLSVEEIQKHSRTYKDLKSRIVKVSKAGGKIICHRALGIGKGTGRSKKDKVFVGGISITTSRLVYLCRTKKFPAKSHEVYTLCGDPRCCRAQHLISELPGKGEARVRCPGSIKSDKYPGILFNACMHKPKCIKITDITNLDTSDSESEIDSFKPLPPRHAVLNISGDDVEEENIDEYEEAFIEKNGTYKDTPEAGKIATSESPVEKDPPTKKRKDPPTKKRKDPPTKEKDPPALMVAYSNEPLPKKKTQKDPPAKKKIKKTPKEDPPPPSPHPAFPPLPKTYIDRSKVTRKYYNENRDYEDPEVDVTVQPKKHCTRSRTRNPPPEESEESEEEDKESQQKFTRRKNKQRK